VPDGTWTVGFSVQATSKDWAADQLGHAATIKAGWKVAMTIQRVDAEGKPL
jgi:hypothetical protein